MLREATSIKTQSDLVTNLDHFYSYRETQRFHGSICSSSCSRRTISYCDLSNRADSQQQQTVHFPHTYGRRASPCHDGGKDVVFHNDAYGRASTLAVSSDFRDSRRRNSDGTKLFPIRPFGVMYDSALQIRILTLAAQ